MSTVIEPPVAQLEKNLEELETVTIRFAGDSGDGMQLTGTQFTNTPQKFVLPPAVCPASADSS